MAGVAGEKEGVRTDPYLRREGRRAEEEGGWKSISPLTIPFLSGHGQPLNELRRFPTHVSECATPKQDRPRNQVRAEGKGM